MNIAILIALALLTPAVALSQSIREVPTITFCELIKNHEQYVGKKVSIYANIEYHANILANLKYVNEHAMLNDPACDSPSMGDRRTIERIDVGYSGSDAEIEALKNQVRELGDFRFGGRARVVATGVLVDETKRALETANYIFSISELKDIQLIILPYQGRLELGWTYSDTFDHIKGDGLKLSEPLKPLLHQAARIEWRNQNNFPILNTGGRKHIVFRVTSSETQQIEPNRWNVTYYCEILEVK